MQSADKDIEWILPGGRLGANVLVEPVEPGGRPGSTVQIVTRGFTDGDHDFMEVASTAVPYAKDCLPLPLPAGHSRIAGLSLGAPPPVRQGGTPNTFCLLLDLPGRWQRESAGAFLYQNGFKDLAAKLGYAGGFGLDFGMPLFPGMESPRQKCWIAPITRAQAEEIVSFVLVAPALTQILSTKIVVSGGHNKVLRIAADPLGTGVQKINVPLPAGELSCPAPVSKVPQRTPNHVDPGDVPDVSGFPRYSSGFTDSAIARISNGLLMRVQLAQSNACGIRKGKPAAVFSTEILLVDVSSDCGATWSVSRPIFPDQLTAPNSNTPLGLSGFDGSAIYYHAQSDRIYVSIRSGNRTVLLSSPGRPARSAADYAWYTVLVFSPGDNVPSMMSVPGGGSRERLFLFTVAGDSPRLLIIEDPVSFQGSSPTVITVPVAGLPVPGRGTLPPSSIPKYPVKSEITGNTWNTVPLLRGNLINQIQLGSVVPLDVSVSDAAGIQHVLRVLYPSVNGAQQVANVVDLVVRQQKNGVAVTGVLDHRVIAGPRSSHILWAQLIPTEDLYGRADREFAFRHVIQWTEVQGERDKTIVQGQSSTLRPVTPLVSATAKTPLRPAPPISTSPSTPAARTPATVGPTPAGYGHYVVFLELGGHPAAVWDQENTTAVEAQKVAEPHLMKWWDPNPGGAPTLPTWWPQGLAFPLSKNLCVTARILRIEPTPGFPGGVSYKRIWDKTNCLPGAKVEPQTALGFKSKAEVYVDCWLPEPGQRPGTGRWTGPQAAGNYFLNQDATPDGNLMWLGEYHSGTFVDVSGSKTRFFVPWPATDESSYQLMGSLISF